MFQKISGREKFFMNKGGITIFCWSFCLTVPKYFIGEHFSVSEKFFYRKFLCIGGGGSITVLLKFFVSQDRNEKLCKRALFFRKFSGIEKNLWIRGRVSRFSVKIFKSHSAENFRKGLLLFLRNFLASKNFMDERRGVSRFSVETSLSHSAEKLRIGTL